MDCLIHPTYFPNVSHFIAMMKTDKVYLEVHGNYQKQTFRNRAEIYGANGKLALSVPVRYTQKNRQLFKDVKISYDENWQHHHLMSLISAYSMSPFFEFYIDDLMTLFKIQFKFLLDLNLKCLEILEEALQVYIPKAVTTKFEINPKDIIDYRYLSQKKNTANTYTPYTQVFSEKHGFKADLSILDLLFNEGPNSELYLVNQKLV
jgi:hypothetical protein